MVQSLTLRAVAAGALLGGVLGVSNLYLGLRTGAAVGVALTACLIALPLHRLLVRLSPRCFGPHLSLLEANLLQTTASAAGYATASSLATSSAAWLLLQGRHVPGGTLLAWTLCTSLLGAFFALPLLRPLLHRERLAFPSGVATAATLRALYAQPGSAPQARALAGAGLGASLLSLLRDLWGWLPAEVSTLPLAVGALVGPRLGASLLLGSAVCQGLLVPSLPAGESSISHTLWPGTALLVSAFLARLAPRGWARVRALGPRTSPVPPEKPTMEVPTPGQVPRPWFWGGTLSLSAATVGVGHAGLGIPWPYGALTVGLSFALVALACRVTGETDSTPPLGQVTQLASGVLLPTNTSANLMASSLTTNSAAVGADLLTSLKAGHLLGAWPRQQFLAQLAGCVAGTLVTVPAFYLLVPEASALGGERFPVPWAFLQLGVARALTQGLEQLGPQVWQATLAATGAGVALALAEALLPERLARRVPSPAGVGLAFLLPASLAVAIFVGGLMAWALQRQRSEAAEQWVLPVASGLLAGEGVVAAGLAVLTGLRGLG